MAYLCLSCGSNQGEPTSDATTHSWYWRILTHGRIGPFCSDKHAKSFYLGNQGIDKSETETRDTGALFTLKEWEHMRFIRETYAQRECTVRSNPWHTEIKPHS